jgi:hypothetical protein
MSRVLAHAIEDAISGLHGIELELWSPKVGKRLRGCASKREYKDMNRDIYLVRHRSNTGYNSILLFNLL